MASDAPVDAPKHSVLSSAFPVLLPEDVALHMPEDKFQALLRKLLHPPDLNDLKDEIVTLDDGGSVTISRDEPKAPFVAGLEQYAAHLRNPEDLAADKQTLTENADVTNISSKNALVDLFYDLGGSTESGKLKTLLENAWSEDPLLTLKVIFNARSIHLGKSNRVAMYKSFGWLAEHHPLTLLANLRWLVRPVIEKKAPKPEDKEKSKGTDEDFDMVDADEADAGKAHDVNYGLSHGYWKDLLNLVVFAAHDQLKFDGDPSSLLNQKRDDSSAGKRKRVWDEKTAKEIRQRKKMKQNEKVQQKMKSDGDAFYRALHITVARLFAHQLKADKILLGSGHKSDLKKLSLAAKWAPTFGEFHDKHTFILSSIAEILFPNPALSCPDAGNRELYLRHIREHYRKQYASPLRKTLSIVERDIAAKTFENIKYNTVPSLAMNRHTGLFIKKDTERFKSFINDVASGKAKISGATLLPSTLISQARNSANHRTNIATNNTKLDFKAVKAAAEAKIQADAVNGQWNTLVQRVRDAGTLQSSIAVCDVSGSMGYPRFKDGSCPMDSAIGLSLLISEVTAPAFGGGFITFSAVPQYISLNEAPRGLVEKVKWMINTHWEMNTNFVAVFEDVILPMAIAKKLKQEDMVKQIFVFSDMQFDQAQSKNSYYGQPEQAEDRWTTSYERIKKKYADARYEMPRLIFWNLAAHSTDKPTTMDDMDTALVSGYSQGMLRALMESGALEDEEEIFEEEVEAEGEDGVMEVRKVKKKIDPLTVVKKAVSNKAYGMLEVVD